MKHLAVVTRHLQEQSDRSPVRPRCPVPREPRPSPFMVVRSSAQETVRDASLAQFWLACGLFLAFEAGALHRGRIEAKGIIKGMVLGGCLALGIFEAAVIGGVW